MNRHWLFTFFACVTLAIVSLAADWPQWRGPNRDGVSKEVGLLKKWPEAGPKLLWQSTELGQGYGSPAVVGDRLYVTGSKGMDDEFVQALNVADGKTIWTSRVGKVGENQNAHYPGARSTPTVDGERILVLGSDGDLACLETKSGKIVWTKNLKRDFGGKTGYWAYAESPLVDGDVVVCTPGGAEATMVALKKSTGEVVWKFAASEADDAGYSSAIVVETEGVKQYVQLLAKGLVGIDAKTGKQLWRYTGIIKDFPNIPTPVSRNDSVYGSTAKGGGGFVRLKRVGNAVEAAEVYRNAKLPTAIGGSVEVNGYLYGTNSAGLMCVEYPKGGEPKWQSRGVGVGSLCYADGMLYVHAETPPGEVALVEATPEEYRERGRFTPPNGPTSRKAVEDVEGKKKSPDGRTWAYPVVANGCLYIRDWNCLWCFDIKDRGLAAIPRK
ncbi:MAG TPA: PQQ-binding-like beta-propeller repeat protein [Pirellulaceae bacterium]|jgi:outer membrane protein assembly factor BamB